MVVSRHAILLANQWEPIRYEQGEALERIEGCVANMLVSAYNSNDTSISNLLKKGSTFFKSKEERGDASLVEDQLEQLLERMVGWKISEKTTPKVDDIANMVARNRPTYLPISRRIVRRSAIDEHSRISMNKRLRDYIDHLKKSNPQEVLLISRLEAKEKERPLTEAERKAKRKAFYEKEARKYMLGCNEEVVDKSLVVFDYSLLEKMQKKKVEKVAECSQTSFKDVHMEDVQVVVPKPPHSVFKTTPQKTQPSTSAAVLPAKKDTQVLGRRQELRKSAGDYLSKQHSMYIEEPALQVVEQGKKRRMGKKAAAVSRKTKRVASPHRHQRFQKRSVQQQKKYIREWQNQAHQQQTEESSEDDGYVEDQSTDEEEVYYRRESTSPEPAKDFYEDEDEFGIIILPGPKLQSCLKQPSHFNLNNAIRRIRFNEQTLTQHFEIGEGCTMEFKTKVDENEKPPVFVFDGKYTVDEARMSRSHKNLIALPHRDAPVPVMKRGHPRLNNKHSLQELKNEIYQCYKDVIKHIEINPNRRVTRWIITDLLLSRLDKRILSNAVVTNIEYPKMPNWLIEYALNREPDLFPKEISYIFVACGFDFEMQYSRDDSNKPFQFLTKLHEWLKRNVEYKQVIYTKNVYPHSGPEPEVKLKCSYFKRIPTIVAITIPEVGDYSGQFQQFNQRLRAHVEMLIEREGPNCTYFNLLDWAELVSQSTDFEDMETVEGRTRLLMEHIANDYGILFHPVAKEPDD